MFEHYRIVVIEELGGYRIIRRLGSGDRANVYLACPVRESLGIGPAALKIFHPAVSHASISVEIEALTRAAGEHCVTLRDLATSPEGGPALILDAHSSNGLEKLLQNRSALSAGEVITMVTPVIAAIRRLHSVGVVHGRLRQSSILFDRSGAPTLACFGAARLFDASSRTISSTVNDPILGDFRSLHELARALLARVSTAEMDDVRLWLSESRTLDRRWSTQLEDRLFSSADPSPVRLTESIEQVLMERRTESPKRSVVRPRQDDADSVKPMEASGHSSRAIASQRWGSLIGRVRSAGASVRPRLWIAMGATAAAFVAAVVFVPANQQDEPPDRPSGATPPRAIERSADPAEAPNASLRPGDEGRAAVDSDDPIAASITLLGARERCMAERSVLCLDDVDQLGSQAAETDRDLIEAIEQGGEANAGVIAQERTLRLKERLGNSALVEISDSALPPESSVSISILIIKGQEGWRIRDYVITPDGAA